MAPSATENGNLSQGQPQALPPPQLYPVKEAHFERYIEPQTDGYRKAVGLGPNGAAIVIDNGASYYRYMVPAAHRG
jgi:actin-related protein 5